MSYSQLEHSIDALISDSLRSQGYDIVRINFSDSENKRLQIMAERQSDKKLNLDDCTKISHLISDILDVEDIIMGEYNLEVSSPGIDRPLVRKNDFENYKNHLIKLTVKQPIDGRRRFKGDLRGITEDDIVVLDVNGAEGSVNIPYDEIENAKLIFTDKLLAEND